MTTDLRTHWPWYAAGLGLLIFFWLLALVGWVVFQIVQRMRKPRRPLGTIEDGARRYTLPA